MEFYFDDDFITKEEKEITVKTINELLNIYSNVKLKGIGDYRSYNKIKNTEEYIEPRYASFHYPENIILINYEKVREFKYGRGIKKIIYHEFGHAIDYSAEIHFIKRISNDYRVNLCYKKYLDCLKDNRNLSNKTQAEISCKEYFAECLVYHHCEELDLSGSEEVISLLHGIYAPIVGYKNK
ncbi:MAG: hypothetical protein E6876_04375 [Clostridium sp.]|nr:hypothetical protein [Clostridium sp.]